MTEDVSSKLAVKADTPAPMTSTPPSWTLTLLEPQAPINLLV